MSHPGCQHPGARHRACVHLAAGHALAHCQRFTGEGARYELLCPACAAADESPDRLAAVCDACFAAAEALGPWHAELGVLGHPGVAARPTQLTFAHEMIRLPFRKVGPLVDVQPIAGRAEPCFLALAQSGSLVLIDLAARSVDVIASLAGAHLPASRARSLHVAPAGDLAAVVADDGNHGVVIDLDGGKLLLPLTRALHPAQVGRFPCAFVPRGGRTLLAHATGWNRLDLSDPRTGECLTSRSFGEVAEGDRPPHYLETIHGPLLLSPDGRFLADDGFSPGGLGQVTSFEVDRWAAVEPWESEDGASRRLLAQRWYAWEEPMCWVGPETLAIAGYGPSRDRLIDVVQLVDVTRAEVRLLAGPAGQLWFDRYLFAVEVEATTVWDLATGERLLEDRGFSPQRYHPGARCFLTANPDAELFIVSRLVGDAAVSSAAESATS